MDARRVDPTDQIRETELPVYRVYFWHESERTNWVSEEWRLVGASNFSEVLDWAHSDSSSRRFVIYAELDDGGIHLIRLQGTDPLDDAGLVSHFSFDPDAR